MDRNLKLGEGAKQEKLNTYFCLPNSEGGGGVTVKKFPFLDNSL